jgi:hypothetical protein
MPRLYGTKPELMTPDAVINFYNENGGGLYRIYLGDSSKNKLRFTGNNEETLHNALSIIEENPVNTNIYTISLFEGAGRKEELKAEINFCFNDNAAVGGVGSNPKLEYYLKKLTEREEDEEDEEEATNGQLLGARFAARTIGRCYPTNCGVNSFQNVTGSTRRRNSGQYGCRG